MGKKETHCLPPSFNPKRHARFGAEAAARQKAAVQSSPLQPQFELLPSVGTWCARLVTEPGPTAPPSIADRKYQSLISMDKDALIQGFQAELKRRDAELAALRGRPN